MFFEPRLGKTKVALDIAGVWALKQPQLRVLILAPRIALDVWESELGKHYPFDYHAETFDEEWGVSGKVFHTKFFLASREEVFRRKLVDDEYERPKQRILEKWDPHLIFVDESHEYKRAGGVGAQDGWRLVRRLRKRHSNGMPYVILLTGTPNPKGWQDLFAQFRIMDDSIFGTNNGDFKEQYVTYGHGKNKWKVTGYRDEKVLLHKIRENSMSLAADQAGMANEQFFQVLHVDLPARAKRMYLELAEEFMTEWEGGVLSAANAGVKRLRLLQLTGGFTTDGKQIHDAKVRTLEAYARLLLEQEESVVVYSRFTAEVQAAYRVLQKVGFRTYRVDGTVDREDRAVAIKALKRRPVQPVAISFQHQAGSRAIELVGAAETVYYSTPDGWVDYFQTRSRTLGPNQKRPVRYTHLIVPGTVDVRTVRNLEHREDGHATMMDNPKRYLYGLR